MKLIRLANELQPPPGKAVCAAIGVFDGLHIGHQTVLHQTLDDARSCNGLAVAITFDRHPNTVVAPDRAPLLIQSLRHKLRGLAEAGFDATWLITFDEAFSRTPADRFVHQLNRDFRRVHSLSVGATFTFGHQRGGNLDLLRELGSKLGFQVHGIPPVTLDGQPVSSSRIRDAIRSGKLDMVNTWLGRTYAISGTVIHGDQLGARIGFPTANLDVVGLALPPAGVYAARTAVDGTPYLAVLNIGHRPTVQTAAAILQFEVHLLDFSGDLYNRDLEVAPCQRLRDEQRFPSLDALRKQITDDVTATRRILEPLQ